MIGLRVNNYDLVSVLGEGGMGTVYLAEHSVMGRKAAIKLLRRELAEDKTLVARFVNEARAANAIRHPNIIDVIDVGTVPESGLPYMMMEFLEGENLSQRLDKVGKLSVPDAVRIALQTASALFAAHGKGIVHRDLKPDNLFLVRDLVSPGTERVKVLDFGIAKLRGDTSSGAVKTNAGSIMGTPPYMSPEQCRGIAEEIDHRSDIYALGIILYEMLCGAPPFVSAGFGELLIMHITRPPTPPRQHNAAIPDRLGRAILQALAKKPAERFASMGEFSAELSAASADVDVPAIPAGPRGRVGGTRRDANVAEPQTLTTLSATTGQIETLQPDAPARPRRKVFVGGLVVAAGAALIAGVAFVGTRRAPVASPIPLAAPAASPVVAPPPPLVPASPPPSPVPGSPPPPSPVVEAPADLAPDPPPRGGPSAGAVSASASARRQTSETLRRAASTSTSTSTSTSKGKGVTRKVAAPRATKDTDVVTPPSAPRAIVSAPPSAPRAIVPPPADAPAPVKTKRSAEKW